MIQIAGIRDAAEAAMLVEEGVEFLGFPLRLPVHREDITEQEAARIIRTLQATCRAVLITYLDKAEEVVGFCDEMGVSIVQLHGPVPVAELEKMKILAPSLTIFKSLVVRDGNYADLASLVRELGPLVDAFVADTYDPATGACGATGKTHDWNISRRLVEQSNRPVILAGGLNPENVREAILRVKPAGVDAHTGVEDADGRKSRLLVRKFVAEAKLGFAGARQATGRE